MTAHSLTWSTRRDNGALVAKGRTHSYSMGYLTMAGYWALTARDDATGRIVYNSAHNVKRFAQEAADFYERNLAA